MKKIIRLFSVFINTIVLSNSAQHEFIFTPTVDQVSIIPATLYAQLVQTMPLCCVDIFVYNPDLNAYLMILRKTAPEKDSWWFIGGRVFKGESFFDCAQRKCQQEAQVTIQPQVILGVYNTIFPDSAWNCQTHTVNIALLAYTTNQTATLAEQDSSYQWVPIDQRPDNPYLYDIYKKADEYITKDKGVMVNIDAAQINIGDVFIHTKRRLHYKIIGFARDADTLEVLVIYQGLYDSDQFGKNPVWCRKLSEFLETVEIDGVVTPRFKKEN